MKVIDEYLEGGFIVNQNGTIGYIRGDETGGFGEPLTSKEVVSTLNEMGTELQLYRKYDDALERAEEKATAFEELKHGVEEAIKEIEKDIIWMNTKSVYMGDGAEGALYILKKHISKYLEE